LEPGVVVVVVGCEVNSQCFGFDIVGLLDLVGEGVKLGLGAGDEEDVEAFFAELQGVFFSYAV